MEQKIPVSSRAVLARVNRILGKEGKALRFSRSQGEKANLGEGYILNTEKGAIEHSHVSLKEWAQKLGAIKAFEEMADD